MTAVLVGGIVVLVAAAGFVALRLYRRGWKTWDDLLWMGTALAVIGGVFSGLDEGLDSAAVGAIFWGIGGTWLYWVSRPSEPPPQVRREDITPEQDRLLDRLVWWLTVATILGVLVELGLAALYVVERIGSLWALLGVLILAVPFAVMFRIRTALRESGPPFDRDFGRMPRRPRR